MESDDRQADGRDEHPDPLTASESQAEVALGEDGQENEPSCEDRLHDRKRSEGEGGDVKPPSSNRHEPADREPAGAEEAGGAPQGMVHDNRRREDGAAMLEQERDARSCGADEGEEEADGSCPGPNACHRLEGGTH